MPYKFIDVCGYTNIYTFFYTFFKSIDVFPSPQENHSRREQAVKVERRRKQQQEEERFRERLRSVSSSSLPYLTTSGRGEQVRGAQGRAWWGCSHQLLALKSSRIVYFEFPLGINKV